VRIRNGNGKVDASDDALVGSGLAESLAIEDICPGGDFDANDASFKRDRTAKRNCQ
jgi:hypothetical protein